MSEPTFNPIEPIVLSEMDIPESEAQHTKAVKTDSVAAHSPASPATNLPTPPQHHVGLSVDERAYKQYQSLAQVVLDSADIASRSAEAAAAASMTLNKATSNFQAMTEVGHKKAVLLLGVAGGLLLICLVFFLVMGVRMNSRINQLDTMMLAVGKRVVDLNAGLESLDVVNRSIESLSALQIEQAKTQGQIETRINEALKKSETIVQTVPGETAKQVAASSDNLLKQVQSINSRLQSQAGAVQSLGNEVKALKGAVGNVDKLNRDVEALVVLQKDRYLETLQKNSANANASRDRAVQFPRANPVAPPSNPAPITAPGATSPTPR